MVGEVEPLKALQDPAMRPQVLERVLTEYPAMVLAKGTKFYRLRIEPNRPADPGSTIAPG